jgi:hypothetical protein
LLPNYDFLTAPEAHRAATKIFHSCNYLQGNEGNIDPVHLSFLHQYLSEAQVARQRIVKGSNVTDNTLLAEDITPTIDVEVTDFGLRIYTLRNAGPDKRYFRVTNFVMPNLSAFGGSTVGDGYAVHWHVPIDDTHHWKYLFMFSRAKPLDAELRNKNRSEVTADYHLTRNKDNRYQQDRESMKTKTFTGMGVNFQAHDAFATESQGPVQDRTNEHVVSSDKAIVAARKLLLTAMREVMDGKEPRHIIRDPEANRLSHLVVLSELLPASTDWKQYVKQIASQHPTSNAGSR